MEGCCWCLLKTTDKGENQQIRTNKMNQQDFLKAVFKRNTTCFRGFPDKQIAEDFIDELFFFLFGTHEKKLGQDNLEQQYEGIKSTFSALLFAFRSRKVFISYINSNSLLSFSPQTVS